MRGKKVWLTAQQQRKRCTAYRRKYGITSHQFDALLKSQGGVCGICGASKRRFVLDHCHTTGNIRGILCHNCNTGLGLFKDNPKTLLAAKDWLIVSHEQNISEQPL